MSDKLKLEPTPITDEGILKQCRDALNKWSRNLSFAITRKLGDDGEFLSASMYHAYTFKIATEFAHRKFVLEKGGVPVDNPTSIERVDMWNIGGAELTGEYKVGLPFTCYAETCEKCGGDGKVECGKCDGQGEVKCSHCHGHGVEKCGACGGTGQEKCSECGGNAQMRCPNCTSGYLPLSGHKDVIFKNEFKKDPWGNCVRCGGSGFLTCTRCGGVGTRTCVKCHGTGELRCKTCHETGRVKCSTCKGEGQVTCSHCDGNGYISYMYHLVQKQGSDSVELVWGDIGIGELRKYKEYDKYLGDDLLARRVENDKQVSVDELSGCDAEFIAELKAKWQEFYSKYDGVEDTFLRFEEVKIRQVDAVVRYEYKYKDKEYLVWIDLTSGKVFETEECGLMTEWGKKIASEGEKYSGKNPQMAIYNYAMACAITTNNAEHAKKIRRQLSFGSWLFRLAAGGLGGWLWSVFMGVQGADPVSGWYVMGAMIVLDVLFAQKWFWLQLVAAGGVYGVVRYLLPYFYTQQIASDVYLQSYLMSAALMFVGGTLLFARDFALRIRGGVLAFPILGALVGGATAPGMYLDFAEKPELMVQIMTYTAYGLCGLALLRTWKRYWVQNCGWIAHKVGGGLARFETNMLKPRFWPLAIHLLAFGAVGYGWYMYAGPGVSIEMKARVAERFLQNERTRDKGKFYLAEAVKADYRPAISQMAEFQIMGKYGFVEDPKRGYELAVKAGDKGDAKAWRLQGFCLEYGKGQRQNLTAANVKYTKAVELGDKEAVALKEKTDEIAKVWEAAYGDNKDAQYGLAVCYANGNGIAKDEGIARQWLLKAADAGHVRAQLLASEWLIKGIGGAKDPETGVKYCEKAALQDDPEATAVLGYYYFDGKIIPQDYSKAIEGFNRACEKGSESAAYMLGHCYREGLGVETNAVKAFEYFKLADERKSLPGAYALGVAYENGVGVNVDYTEALGGYTRACEAEWEDPLTGNTTANAKTGCDRIGEIGKYWKSANAENNAEAQYHVGLCFANGTGVAKNLETAYGWYVKSAEQNFTEGIVSMADALYYGRGVSEDKAAAAKAYERGDQADDVHSTYMLAVSYENGYGFEKNLTTAFTLYGKAAEKEYAGASDAAKVIAVPAQYWDDAMVKKDAIAQYKLGCCYSRGNCGVNKDDLQAFKLFRMSADQGNEDALYVVSLCYRDGIGTGKNKEEQKKALFAAAKKSHVASLATIGDLYRDGNLVNRDFTMSLEYFNKAIEGGLEAAKSSAAQINKIGLYWKAANDGGAEAQFNLGVCYRDGVQITANDDAATLWFEKSAAQGNHEAEYAFAEMLSRRQPSSDATDKKIVGLLQKAVAANHIKAKTLLGKYLYTGKGIDEDYDKAVELWEDAAKSGDLDAKCELAGFHFTGRGMFNSGKDQDKALKEWTEAVAANHIESAFRLGKYYAGGSGLFSSGKNIPKAKQYLLVAANAGHRKAMAELADVLSDSDSVAEKQEGESWLTKSKQPIELIRIVYKATVEDTVDGMVCQVITDDAVNASEAAKQNINAQAKETDEASACDDRVTQNDGDVEPSDVKEEKPADTQPAPDNETEEQLEEADPESEAKSSNDDNPIGAALGDPKRVWETGGKPSKEGEDVNWHVSNHGNTAGREVYVGSGAGGAGRAASYLHTKVTGPCKISFAYRIGTYKGHAIVWCDKEELMHFNDVADAKFDWKEATYEIPAGDHLLAFAYIHPGRGFTNHFSGFLIADFKVSPVE